MSSIEFKELFILIKQNLGLLGLFDSNTSSIQESLSNLTNGKYDLQIHAF